VRLDRDAAERPLEGGTPAAEEDELAVPLRPRTEVEPRRRRHGEGKLERAVPLEQAEDLGKPLSQCGGDPGEKDMGVAELGHAGALPGAKRLLRGGRSGAAVALEDDRSVAAFGQQDRGREPGDAAPDDRRGTAASSPRPFPRSSHPSEATERAFARQPWFGERFEGERLEGKRWEVAVGSGGNCCRLPPIRAASSAGVAAR